MEQDAKYMSSLEKLD